jgi:hypothetical protein
MIAAGTVDGAGMPSPSPFTGLPHPPQNRVPGFRAMPHEVQESDGEGTGARGGLGDAGDPANITCGLISPSLIPQTLQNFSS